MFMSGNKSPSSDEYRTPSYVQQPQANQNNSNSKRTQADQNKDDDTARQKAQEGLIQSWMDRLQLISVIATFFAANEAQLLSITTPMDDPDQTSAVMQTANSMLSGALVLHSFSAVIAFLGAFVLVKYKLTEAKQEEAKEEGKAGVGQPSQSNGFWSSNPHIEQVGYFRAKRPPVHLLHSAHSIAVTTAGIGFVFGIVGIICYAWSQQARSVGIFSSACIGACVVFTALLLNPLRKATEEES